MENTSETMQLLTFTLADETYALEVQSISEILELQRITRIPRTADYLIGVMNVRGKVVPVADLRLKLGLPGTEPTPESAIVVLEASSEDGDSLIGVLVDTVSKVLELPSTEIEPAPRVGTTADSEFLAGMVKHEDHFILIARTDRLFSLEDIEVARQTNAQSEQVLAEANA